MQLLTWASSISGAPYRKQRVNKSIEISEYFRLWEGKSTRSPQQGSYTLADIFFLTDFCCFLAPSCPSCWNLRGSTLRRNNVGHKQTVDLSFNTDS